MKLPTSDVFLEHHHPLPNRVLTISDEDEEGISDAQKQQQSKKLRIKMTITKKRMLTSSYVRHKTD